MLLLSYLWFTPKSWHKFPIKQAENKQTRSYASIEAASMDYAKYFRVDTTVPGNRPLAAVLSIGINISALHIPRRDTPIRPGGGTCDCPRESWQHQQPPEHPRNSIYETDWERNRRKIIAKERLVTSGTAPSLNEWKQQYIMPYHTRCCCCWYETQLLLSASWQLD